MDHFFRPGAPGRCLEGPGMSSLPGNHDKQENIPGIIFFMAFEGFKGTTT